MIETNLQKTFIHFLKPEEQIIFENIQINNDKSNDKLIYQITHYNHGQCQRIIDMNLRYCLLFGDNYEDKIRSKYVHRKGFYGQAYICGNHDRDIAYGFVTVFDDNTTIDKKKEIWKEHFTELKKIKFFCKVII